MGGNQRVKRGQPLRVGSSHPTPDDAHGSMGKQPMKETIIEELNELRIDVIAGDVRYQLRHDDVTGDWVVHSQGDELIQGDWVETKNDAIKYALERAGVIEDANYQRAPDRTSA